jgi:hypothetical protein
MTELLPWRFLLVVGLALSLCGCKEGTEFTVNTSFATVVQRLQVRLPNVPALKDPMLAHTYADHLFFSYLDSSDPAASRRVSILVRKGGEYTTDVTIRCESIAPKASGGGTTRLPSAEQQIRLKLFSTAAAS